MDGLYHQKYDYPPETMLSHDFFVRHPEEFFRFYRDKMLPLEAQPNEAHLKLAELEQAGKLLAIITQNIDGLHQKAGSKKVYELHGSVHRNYCTLCGKFYDAEFMRSTQGIPGAAAEGLSSRMWCFTGKAWTARVMAGAAKAIDQADLLIVGGTSLVVYPAAGFVANYRGGKLVLINRDPTPYDNRADYLFRDSIGELFSQIRV